MAQKPEVERHKHMRVDSKNEAVESMRGSCPSPGNSCALIPGGRVLRESESSFRRGSPDWED